MAENRVVPRVSLWLWIGFCIPFVLFAIHLFMKQDTRPFKERIKREVYAKWTCSGSDTVLVRVLGTYNHNIHNAIVEDRYGNRMDYGEVHGDVDLSGLAVLQRDAAYYVAPASLADVSALFNGSDIAGLIEKYGDYTCCSVKGGLYKFPQIVPVVDGKRYEDGLIFTVKNGRVVHTVLADAEYTTSNLFLRLPFAEKILSLNMGRAHFVPYCEISEDADDGGGNFIVRSLLVFVYSVLGLVILFVFLIFCAYVCGLLWLPLGYFLSYHTSIGNNVIRGIMAVLSLPFVYVAAITMSDVVTGLWLVIFPLMIVVGMVASALAITMPVDGRCPKCKSVGTLRKSLVSKTFKKEYYFWQSGEPVVESRKIKGNVVFSNIRVEKRYIKRKQMLMVYEISCSHCSYKKREEEIANLDEVIKTEIVRSIDAKKILADEIVYIVDDSGKKVRCIKSPYSDVHLTSYEEPGVFYHQQPDGTYKKKNY